MSILDKIGGFASVAKLASGGPAAMTPLLAQAMPNTLRVLATQRHAARLAEQAAAVSRACGDVLAAALAAGADVPQDHLDALCRSAVVAQVHHSRMQATAYGTDAGIADLQRAYGYPREAPAPSAEIVPLAAARG